MSAYDEANLDHVCATVEVRHLLIRATAAARGWGPYDVDDDPEDLFDELGEVVEALAAEGWIDFARYVFTHHQSDGPVSGGTGRLGSDPDSIGGGSGVRIPGVADPSLPEQAPHQSDGRTGEEVEK